MFENKQMFHDKIENMKTIIYQVIHANLLICKLPNLKYDME